MATINRVEVVWAGLGGLPGLSVFHSTGGTDPTGDLVTFFTAIKGMFPTGLTWAVPNVGDTIDDTTGTLNGGWTGTGGGTVAANGGTPAYAQGVGAMVKHETTAIINGRRLKGRTFFTSLSAAYYNTNGQVSSAGVTTFNGACTAFVAAGKFRIWHRPPPHGSSGSSALISSSAALTNVTTLKTRRF